MNETTAAAQRRGSTYWSLVLAKYALLLSSYFFPFFGILAIIIGVSDERFLLFVMGVFMAIYGTIVSAGLLQVVSHTLKTMFPHDQESTNMPTCEIQCQQGHSFEVLKSKAGSSVACPKCGSTTSVPSLSVLQGTPPAV